MRNYEHCRQNVELLNGYRGCAKIVPYGVKIFETINKNFRDGELANPSIGSIDREELPANIAQILYRQEKSGKTTEKIIKNKEKTAMGKVRLNEDSEVVATVKEGLKRTGGYCPCRLERKPEYKCICEEFKAQIQDPDFEGYCHCRLYYKEK